MSTSRTPIRAPDYEYSLEQLAKVRTQFSAQQAQLRQDSQQQLEQLRNDNPQLHQTLL